MMRDANSAIERAMMLHQGRNEDALKHYDRALALSPRYAMAHNNRGMSLLALGRNEEALTSFQRAVAIEPGYAEARWNAALIALVTGDFQTGWEMHEARWQINGRQPPWFAGLPPWNGEPVAGKTVLVYGEQGYGDFVHFARYLPLLAARLAERLG